HSLFRLRGAFFVFGDAALLPARVLNVAAALGHAAHARALAVLALDQERGAALRALLGDRPIPQHEVAPGLAVVGAAVERLAAARPLLRQEPAAARPWTVHPERDRLGGLAVGIARAREELPEPAALDLHRRAARRAFLVGGDLRRDLDRAVLLA